MYIRDCKSIRDIQFNFCRSGGDLTDQSYIPFSLSPGSSVAPALAKEVSGLVNMYRIIGDDWDSWKDIASHFDISRWLKYYLLQFDTYLPLLSKLYLLQ